MDGNQVAARIIREYEPSPTIEAAQARPSLICSVALTIHRNYCTEPDVRSSVSSSSIRANGAHEGLN